MSEWVKKSLGDFMFFQRGHDLSRNNMKVGNIPVAGSNGVIGFHNASTTIAPGITIGRSGNIGTPHFYQENFWAHNTVLYVKDFKGNDPLFCYYLLKTIDFSGFNTGSAVPTLNRNHIHEYKINTPPVKEQKVIASVLSSLDDKIDLLHRQNKTLESMAETLFRQWFVEEVDDSWILSSIGEVFDIKGGATPSTKESLFWNGNINWTSPRDLSGAKSIYLLSTERQITELGLSKISSGLLPNNTLLMSSRAPVGYLAITDIELAINQGYIAILEHENFGCEYMYLWCKVNMDIIKNSANGSVFQEISKASFKKIPFLIPDDERVKSFNKQGKILFKKIKSNTKNIQTLENLRDTLLPKLMSGEVRVKYTPEEIKQ